MKFLNLKQQLVGIHGVSGDHVSRLGPMDRVLIGLCCLLVSTMLWASHPYQQWADELGIDMDVSYDAIRTMEAQGEVFKATERKAPGKMFTEVNVGQMSAGVILREDLNKSFMLMPSMQMYREETLEGGMLQSANGLEFQSIEEDGRDEINGYDSTKYKVRFEDNEGKGAGFVWVADVGVPMKMDMIYSNRSMKGQRITMELTELTLREQDPKWFEVPEGFRPMGVSGFGSMFGDAMNGASADPGTPQSADTEQASDESDADRQACLERAAIRAREEQEAAEKKRGLGRLMRSVSRTASRFGLDGVGELTRDIYDANATKQDMEVIAEELGISEEEVQNCYDNY